jgi:hypothetical protein
MIKTLLVAAAALALSAGAASADIQIFAGSVPQNPDENVLLNTGMTGTTVIGTTNQTNSSVTITGTEALSEPSNGQARIEAVDGAFTNLGIRLSNSALTFVRAEFNINAATAGTVTISGLDNMNEAFSQNFSLGANGQNFFNLVGINGQSIRNLSIVSTAPITDVRQIRLGGVAGVAGAVPEPATWAMMILGFGMVGAGLRLRRRREEDFTAA